MSKKLNNLKWKSVALEGFPISGSEDFQGFVALEECKSYGLDKDNKNGKKKKQKKRKNDQSTNIIEVPKKKVKLSNGFTVESCDAVKPSTDNQIDIKNISNDSCIFTNNKKKNEHKLVQKDKIPEEMKGKKKQNKHTKKSIPKLGENITEVIHNLTSEDMLTWAEFKLPDEIVKALAELGYKQPTKIQQLTLPAAIHGRRDILGAAETGSGKTLAFGLPILTGIIKLKEKAALKGLNVQDIPYKKTSNKKKNQSEHVKPNQNKKIHKNNKTNNKVKHKSEKLEIKNKESSEDGYGSGDESGDDDEQQTSKVNNKNTPKSSKKDYDDDDEYSEEIEVPIRKRDNSADEGNDSDSDDNYVHLSEMLDSDDLADSSSNEDDELKEDEENDDSEESGEESESENELDETEEQSDESLSDVDDKNTGDGVESSQENEDTDEQTHTQDEIEESQGGIGCVKVIDDIELPEPTVPKSDKPLYALILTPTRELAIQISRHLIAVAKYTGIRIGTIVGGMARQKQERVLDKGPEVVVATPGRLWELLTHPHIAQAKHIKFLAIDETDRMIERGHFEELTLLLERINADEERKSSRQNFVFSATLTMVHDLPSHMKGKKVTKRGKIINRKVEKMTPQQKIKRLTTMIGMTDPKVVDITTQLGTAETLTECRIACAFDHKDAYLYYLLKRHPGRTIVFCNSIGCVRRLAQLLTVLQCNPLPLHASMQQRQRLKNLEKFSHESNGVLIATDVAARGLDIPDVQHVVHYQVPRTAENYVHRSGRTARANKEGLTILMMEPAEAYKYMKLCRTLNKTSELPTFPVPPQYLEPMKATVAVARDIDSLELKRRRAAQAQGWRDRVANEMDMIVDDDDVPVKTIDPSIDKALQVKRKQLKAMLSRPVFPRGFSFKYPTTNDPDALKQPNENALQVMKKALESGQLKKEKRKGKNDSLLKLEKAFKTKK